MPPNRSPIQRVTQKLRESLSGSKTPPEEVLDPEKVRDPEGIVNPENLIWIFGTARTGSTWLSRIMGGMPGHVVWDEPLVGEIFGTIMYPRERWEHRSKRGNFIMGERHRNVYLDSIRNFTFDGALSRFPRAKSWHRIVIKEPHGSLGSPLLMQAFPESRMVFLVRDPRDVTASGIDAHEEGGWANKWKGEDLKAAAGKRNSEAKARQRAEMYLRDMTATKEAYEAHAGHKSVVRYEDLRVDAFGEMKRVYKEIDVPVNEEKLRHSIGERDWDNVPEEDKGPGKSKRKAKPGGWREDLSPRQIEIVERITSPFIAEFYSDYYVED